MLRTADILVSTSADGTLRAWSLDTGMELCGYQMLAGALAYDESRDVLLVGGHDGRVLALRFAMGTQGKLAATVLRKEEGRGEGVTALAYDATSDCLLSGDIEGHARVWRNFTNVAPNVVTSTPLDDTSIDSLLTALNHPIELAPTPDQIPDVQNKQQLFDLYVQLIDAGTPHGRTVLEKLTDQFKTTISHLQRDLQANTTRQATALNEVRSMNGPLLDEKRAVMELQARHQQERDEMQARQTKEMETLRKRIPSVRRDAASTIQKLQSAYQTRQTELIQHYSTTLQQYLVSAFPSGSIIAERYQAGDPVLSDGRPTAVYRGVDLRSQQLVAIKVFPPAVTLSTTLKHEVLLPVLDTFATSRNTFVVTPMMKVFLAISFCH